MADNKKQNINLNKSKSQSNNFKIFSKTTKNFMKNDELFQDNNEMNYKKYLSRKVIFTRFNIEHKKKMVKSNHSFQNKIRNFNQEYEETLQNTLEEKREAEQFHKLYGKLKKETEEYLKKKEGRNYEELAFADLIAHYTKLGYKIPTFKNDKNLFDPSTLLLPNEKIPSYYEFVEKLNYLEDTKLKKNFYIDLNLLHDLTDQVNARISGQESHKLGNIDKANNMIRINRIRKEGTRKEIRDIKEHIKKIKFNFEENINLDKSKTDEDIFTEERDQFDSQVKNFGRKISIRKSLKWHESDGLIKQERFPLRLDINNSTKSLNKLVSNKSEFKMVKLASHDEISNDGQSTYFNTKSTFNHSKTMTNPFHLRTHEKSKNQEGDTKIKFSSSKMKSSNLNLVPIQGGNYSYNTFLRKISKVNFIPEVNTKR